MDFCIDWLQPYEYLVNLVILNLPRFIRYKRENVILFGIIPGPNELLQFINTYLSPLVYVLINFGKELNLGLPGQDQIQEQL